MVQSDFVEGATSTAGQYESRETRECGQLTLRGPWSLEVHFAKSSFPIQHQLGLYTVVTLVRSMYAKGPRATNY